MPWIATIVRRELSRARSARYRHIETLLDPVDMPEAAHHDESLEAIERTSFAATLARLSDDERRILWLRYDEDLTQPAIAAVLGIPEGTVKVRLHRARGRLRTLLERDAS